METEMPHRLVLSERGNLSLTGVTEAVSFDEEAVVMKTTLGILTIQGSGLQMKNLSLDGGQVTVEGHIDALAYEESRPAGGFWHRLLR